MKRIIRIVSVALCISGTTLAAPTIEKPTPLPDAMVSIAIPNLHGFIDALGNVAAQGSPMMSGMMIKNMAGMQIGDPGLAGFGPEKGLAFIMLNPTNSFTLLEVNEAQMPAYTNVFAAQGMHCTYQDGTLIAGASPTDAKAALAKVPTLKKTILANRAPALRISCEPDTLVERHNEQLITSIQHLPGLMQQCSQTDPNCSLTNMQAMAALLEGELRVLLSLAAQCESAELILSAQNGTLQLDKILATKSGTSLAELAKEKTASTTETKLQAGLLADTSYVRGDFAYGDLTLWTSLLDSEMKKLSEVMNLKSFSPEHLAPLRQWAKVLKSNHCQVIGFDPEGTINAAYLAEIGDKDQTLKLLKALKTDTAPLLNLYENMGMKLQIEFIENAREYKGIKIHQLKTSTDGGAMNKQAAEQMLKMGFGNFTYDVAITDNTLIYASGTPSIKEVIDRLQDENFKPEPLEARRTHPEGGCFYVDIDLAEYFAMITSVMPADDPSAATLNQLMPMVAGADPITSAGYGNNGLLKISLALPGDLLAKLSQAVMMMQMQKMQQGGAGGIPPGF